MEKVEIVKDNNHYKSKMLRKNQKVHNIFLRKFPNKATFLQFQNGKKPI